MQRKSTGLYVSLGFALLPERDGTAHEHTVVRSHGHDHIMTEGRHGHHHTKEEPESALNGAENG